MSTRLTTHRFGLLDVSVDASERRHVVSLEGELDLANTPGFISVFEAVVAHANAIVVDLDRLSFIDSTGLHAILECEGKCQHHGIGFAVTEGSPQVRRLFEVTGAAAHLPVVGQGRDFAATRRAEVAPSRGR